MPPASYDTQSEALRDWGDSVPSTEDDETGGLLRKISKPPSLLISFHAAGGWGGWREQHVLSWKLNTLQRFPKGLWTQLSDFKVVFCEPPGEGVWPINR